MNEKQPNPNFKKRRAIGGGLVAALAIITAAACSSNPGQRPETVSECQQATAEDLRAHVGSGDSNDPQVLLDWLEDPEVSQKDRTGYVGFGSHADKIDGLGELVCKATAPDGSTELFFLTENAYVRDEYSVSGEGVMRRVQQQQSTTTTTIG